MYNLSNDEVSKVVEICAKAGGCQLPIVYGKVRRTKYVDCRITICNILRQLYGLSYGDIGPMIKRDRTTVRYYFQEHDRRVGISERYPTRDGSYADKYIQMYHLAKKEVEKHLTPRGQND